MWAATRWTVVWAGLAAGALASALCFGVGYLATSSATGGPARALVLTGSLVVGLVTSGWVAGRLAHHSGRFHGALAGLGLALIVVVVARLGGSPAPTGQVLLLAGLAITLSGLSGWIGARRR